MTIRITSRTPLRDAARAEAEAERKLHVASIRALSDDDLVRARCAVGCNVHAMSALRRAESQRVLLDAEIERRRKRDATKRKLAHKRCHRGCTKPG